MRKILRIVGFSLLGLLLLIVIGGGAFVYKARYGFNFYDTNPPELPANLGDNAVLVFSKTNGYRHADAIEASQSAFKQMAAENGWSLFATENGAVFNPEQLARFRVVVYNNTSGKALNDAQREAFRDYLATGGGFVGIHAAGDNSHQWEWYEGQVIRAEFSHHPLSPQIQSATVYLEPDAAEHPLTEGLPARWSREEEWYMFFDSPRNSGSEILYTLDETDIDPSGNLGFVVTDKNWGMDDDHPIAWYHLVGKGRVFYSALGHQASAFQEPEHLRMLENAIRWAGQLNNER